MESDELTDEEKALKMKKLETTIEDQSKLLAEEKKRILE